MNDRPATIVDVARAAGVSHSTVSRVLNGQRHVKASTRERVQNAADQLGYVANVQARKLAGGKTGVIGLVAMDLASPYIIALARAIDEALADRSLDLMLCTTHRREQREHAYVRQLSLGFVDGLIVLIPSSLNRYTDDLLDRNFPFVLLDHLTAPRAYTVSSANRIGTRLVVQHLAGLGHRRIAIISGDRAYDVGGERLAAFRDAQQEFGIDSDPELIIKRELNNHQTGNEGMRRLLKLKQPPTAVFATADTSAIGALEVLQEQGISVPAEMSVVGFDDIPEASRARVPLTTIRQPIDRIAQEAVELLMSQIESADRSPVHLSLPVDLVVRNSTAPCPT